MPVALRFLSSRLPRLETFIRSRFETKARRFRLAVSSGFVIVAVGTLVLGAGSSFGIAESIWGIMEIPGLSAPPQAASSYGAPSAQYRISKHRHARRDADDESERHGDHRKARHKHLASREDKSDRGDNAGPVQLAGTSMCVRLCDGFVFPVGNYYGDGDRAAHEATCQSECPGAKTALYVRPAGSDTIGDATQVASGKNYSQMADAFHYTTYVDEACSCHPAGGNRVKSLLRDFTLRRGDTIMTSKGLQVFHGGTGYPFKRRDFVALNKSRDIQQAARTSLRAIERASLIATTNVASRPLPATAKTAAVRPGPGATPPTVASQANRVTTKGLQHQARS